MCNVVILLVYIHMQRCHFSLFTYMCSVAILGGLHTHVALQFFGVYIHV